jgi:hypothetical protein
MVSRRVHIVNRGDEENVSACGFCDRDIPVKVPGIAIKILTGSELRRIHKDGSHHNIRLTPCCPDETRMPLVEESHCWNEPNAFPIEPMLSSDLLHLLHVVDPDGHEGGGND